MLVRRLSTAAAAPKLSLNQQYNQFWARNPRLAEAHEMNEIGGTIVGGLIGVAIGMNYSESFYDSAIVGPVIPKEEDMVLKRWLFCCGTTLLVIKTSIEFVSLWPVTFPIGIAMYSLDNGKKKNKKLLEKQV